MDAVPVTGASDVVDAGADQRLGDRVRRRGRLLSSQWRHRICRQRRKRSSFDAATRSDDTA